MMVWSRVVCFLVLAALNFQVFRDVVPSVLWCWRQKGIRPVKNWVVGCWHGYLSGARCRLHMAQLMPLPLTVSCFSKIQIGFTFLVLAHPVVPDKGSLNVCVPVRVRACCLWCWRAFLFVLYVSYVSQWYFNYRNLELCINTSINHYKERNLSQDSGVN